MPETLVLGTFSATKATTLSQQHLAGCDDRGYGAGAQLLQPAFSAPTTLAATYFGGTFDTKLNFLAVMSGIAEAFTYCKKFA
jgi:hypothetical protein